jgi:hypothetical protein
MTSTSRGGDESPPTRALTSQRTPKRRSTPTKAPPFHTSGGRAANTPSEHGHRGPPVLVRYFQIPARACRGRLSCTRVGPQQRAMRAATGSCTGACPWAPIFPFKQHRSEGSTRAATEGRPDKHACGGSGGRRQKLWPSASPTQLFFIVSRSPRFSVSMLTAELPCTPLGSGVQHRMVIES